MQFLGRARLRLAYVQPLVMRWLHHICASPPPVGDYLPDSLATEGFIHCSYKDAVKESAALYFKGVSQLYVYRIDPRRLSARVEVAPSPRGPMPHVHGPIERDAIREVISLDALAARPDEVTGTRFGFVAFPNMTLLDLIGIYDPISRLQSMKFDVDSSCEIIGGVSEADWSADGATLRVSRVRPDLSQFDVLVLPGGHGSRVLEKDDAFVAWLKTFPQNRMVVSVCTGALLLGAMGRLLGKRATTHRSAISELARFGATAVEARVVDAGQVITSGGVTAGIDCGLWVVRRLMGKDISDKVATQMEHTETPIDPASRVC